MSGTGPHLEIERVFLLRGMPPIPEPSEVLRIEQGYFDAAGAAQAGLAAEEGRVRRTTDLHGRVRHFLTRKRGSGLVREEEEREIAPELFDALWAATGDRRLRKDRHRVAHDGLVWEIDRFEQPEIVLAEAELPCADHPLAIPGWLVPWIEREVTEEPAYRNSAIAFRLARQGDLR